MVSLYLLPVTPFQLEYLHTTDLYHLAQPNKTFRYIFLSPKYGTLWALADFAPGKRLYHECIVSIEDIMINRVNHNFFLLIKMLTQRAHVRCSFSPRFHDVQ